MIKLLLFTYDIIIHLENRGEPAEKLLALMGV